MRGVAVTVSAARSVLVITPASATQLADGSAVTLGIVMLSRVVVITENPDARPTDVAASRS